MSSEKQIAITQTILTQLFGDQPDQLGVRLWDGSHWPDRAPKPVTLVLKHPGALRSMLLPPTELGLAEAYLYDDFDVEGDIQAVYALSDDLLDSISAWRTRINLLWKLMQLPTGNDGQQAQDTRAAAELSGSQHSVKRDREAIAYHYDVSNDFYQLFLDDQMVYSCAYFHSEDEDLNTAQARKLDYLCRKLRLQPGQRLLDIGCGWGGLVIHAAREYGVEAVGITLSERQVELANKRIAEAGLEDRCQVRYQDYREVDDPEGFDALVSVGMFEHVGSALLEEYFSRAWQLLKPRSVFMNHGIAATMRDEGQPGKGFSDTYVFPDGELVPISTTARVAEECNFEVRDVESLREHYALTLDRWVERLEANHKEALRHVNEPTYRVWRLFMSASAYNFRRERLNLYQTLLAKPDQQGRNGLPLTRRGWYVEP